MYFNRGWAAIRNGLLVAGIGVAPLVAYPHLPPPPIPWAVLITFVLAGAGLIAWGIWTLGQSGRE